MGILAFDAHSPFFLVIMFFQIQVVNFSPDVIYMVFHNFYYHSIKFFNFPGKVKR